MTPKTQTNNGLAGLVLALLLAGCATTAPQPASPDLKIDTRPPAASAAPAIAAPVAEPAPEAPAPAIDDANAVYFASGSTEVDAAGEQKLRAHALRLSADRKTIVTLTGLTDNQGSRSFNLLLAEQRIESVARILRSLGVQKSQIRPYALGSKAPAVACRSAACRGKMRRVEIDYAQQ